MWRLGPAAGPSGSWLFSPRAARCVALSLFALVAYSLPVAGSDKPEAPKAKAGDQQVTGTIRDRDGKGLAELKVQIMRPRPKPNQPGTVVDTVTTDSKGLFRFTGPPGDYALRVVVGGKPVDLNATIGRDGLDPAAFTVE